MFDDLLKCELNLLLEIGLYTNHEVTLQLSNVNGNFIIEDLVGDGYIGNSRIVCGNSGDFESVINKWLTNSLS